MAIEIMPQNTDLVKKSNALARAKRSSESIWIGRMVAIVASQIHTDDADFKEYQIPVPVILDTTNKSRSGQFYDDLIKSVKKAMGMVVEFEDEKEWRGYHMFDTCRYVKGSGVVNVKIHPDLKPQYLELKKNFTQYRLTEYLALPSVYSQTLYEYLRSWDDKPEHTEPIEKLHEMLCTPPSMQKNFGELKRRVLDKAHKDIHKYTKLKFEWEPVKRGRKVVKVRFIFNTKKAAQAKAKAKREDNNKIVVKNRAAFLQAAACAAAGCPGRGSKPFCSACFSMPKE